MPQLVWKLGIMMMLWADLLAGGSGALWDQGSGGMIRGRVFIDENRNGEYDPGEPLLEGIQINISTPNVDWTHIVFTSADGSFSLPVGPGEWKAVLSPPEGFSVMNDPTRQVLIGREGTFEAVMEFALTPTGMAAAMEAEEALSVPEPVAGSGDMEGSRSSSEQDFEEGELRAREGDLRVLDATAEHSELTPAGSASSPSPLSMLEIMALASIIIILILVFVRRLIS
jgi:hypothetical protein